MRFLKQKKTYIVLLLSAAVCAVTIKKVPYDDLINFVNAVVDRDFQEGPCACKESCLAANEDEWFVERFRPDIPPLLSAQNSDLPENILEWWQHLQSTKTKSNYSQVIKELFAVIPGEDRYRDAGPRRCRTCAVVGNSGNLLNSSYGPLIDSNNFVIRMNKGPVKGFEKDVGFKTTHRIIYPESAVHLDDNNTHLVLMPFKLLDLQWVTSALSTGTIKRTRFKVIDRLQANKNNAMVVHPVFIHYVHSTWLHIKSRRSYPSTGFLALMFAMHICDEVNVFGFGANSKGTWHHYFENTPRFFRRTGKHSGNTEFQTILALQKKNLINLHLGL